jgi:hypothetical protein
MISPTVRFQDISDIFISNEVSLMGASSFFFVLLLYWLNPITTIERQEIVSRDHLEKGMLPGILNGIFIASAFIFLFSIAGIYHNLGYLIRIQEAPLELANVLLRMIMLAVFVYFEEFVFRFQLTRYFSSKTSDPVSIALIGIMYCAIKGLQFKLSLIQLSTLFLVSTALSCRALTGDRFSKGAGIWAGILITFHPLLSLPIFGNSFSGLLLMKPAEGIRFFTGGAGGPLSSVGFQLLLIMDISRTILKRGPLMLTRMNAHNQTRA